MQQGGCPDAYRVQVLVQNVGMGTGAQVRLSAIDGYGRYLAWDDQGSKCEDSLGVTGCNTGVGCLSHPG